MQTIDIDELKLKIVEALKPLNSDKIILFRSYTYGEPNEDSDIDLYIVTNDDYMPQSWREKIDLKLKFAKLLKDIKQYYDIDSIIHTKAMYKKFLELDSMFSKEILTKGQIIYGNK